MQELYPTTEKSIQEESQDVWQEGKENLANIFMWLLEQDKKQNPADYKKQSHQDYEDLC